MFRVTFQPRQWRVRGKIQQTSFSFVGESGWHRPTQSASNLQKLEDCGPKMRILLLSKLQDSRCTCCRQRGQGLSPRNPKMDDRTEAREIQLPIEPQIFRKKWFSVFTSSLVVRKSQQCLRCQYLHMIESNIYGATAPRLSTSTYHLTGTKSKTSTLSHGNLVSCHKFSNEIFYSNVRGFWQNDTPPGYHTA